MALAQLRDAVRRSTPTRPTSSTCSATTSKRSDARSTSGATTDELLTRIRDDIGLGAALATLDLSGKGPDASHRDDLNALIAVATFEPDPAAFEPWLRTRLRAANEPARDDGVAVSTVHRVKGMEWPYVVVLGAHDGLMPHTLADDIEEERRIFHVAITRGDTAVHVVADAKSPAPFLEQLHTPAPADYAPSAAQARHEGRPERRRGRRAARARCGAEGMAQATRATADGSRVHRAQRRAPRGHRDGRRRRSTSSRVARASARRNWSATATRSSR